jgi:hypothetical protein
MMTPLRVKNTKNVMLLNWVQHLIKSMTYEILKS